MRDYAELILDLRRHHCDAKEDDTQEVFENCAYDVIISDKSKFSGITDVCACGLMHRAADAIEELQAQSPKTGKWIPDDEDDPRLVVPIRCSVCHSRAHFEDWNRRFVLSEYCPHCGAKMEVTDDAEVH